MSNALKVSVGKPNIGGAVFRAPLDTELPTTATAALDESFMDLGYVSDDGVTNSQERSTEEIKAWGGDVVLNPQTEKKDTFKFVLIESLNADVVKTVYGDTNVEVNVGTNLPTTVKANAKELPYSSWVIDTIMTGDVLHRIVVPNGKITETGETVYKDNEAIGYEVTLTAYPDSDGNSHYEYYGTEGD